MSGKGKKHILIFFVMVLMACVVTGCEKDHENTLQEIEEKMQNHSSLAMQEEGVWYERYVGGDYDIENKVINMPLSVVVSRDLNDDEILEILDYYELYGQSKYLTNSDFTCYAVFFKVNVVDDVENFEEYKRVKYMNGDIVPITDEDTYNFPASYMKSKSDEEIEEEFDEEIEEFFKNR